MISESRAERFVRLLQDYRTNVDVDYRTLVTQKRKFEEHRKLHALLQQVTRLSGRALEIVHTHTHIHITGVQKSCSIFITRRVE